ncbi:MAG TPA: class I SAM-dependent methyltransferase [Thermoleophilia bacterium]|nr:class I SAM-dependent methyltransferase [Thermoleophilia bacterium]
MQARGFLDTRFIRQMITRGIPLGQFVQSPEDAVKQADLGFGFLYYALARILKPRLVVVVGSYRGFSVICLALGLVHNGKGRLHFVDAAIVDDFWTDPGHARRHFQSFGVASRVSLQQMTTQRWLQKASKQHRGRPFIDLLLLDGDHTFGGVSFDFRRLGRLVKDGGYICLHDSFVGGFGLTEWEVADFLSTLGADLFEVLTFEVAQGLTVIKKLPRTMTVRAGLRDRRRLRKALARLGRAKNGNRPATLVGLQRTLREVLTETVHLDRILEIRRRFLAKSNSDLRRRNKTLRLENRMLQQMARPRKRRAPSAP